MGIYYGHVIPSRMIKDCPNVKKKNEKNNFKAKKRNNKAKILAWISSDSNGNKSKEQEMGNRCLMAKGDLEEKEDENFEEVSLEHFLTFTKECLAQGL